MANSDKRQELVDKLAHLEIGTFDQDKGDHILHRYIASHSINAIVALCNTYTAAVIDDVIGEKLGEDDGWSHFFSEEARCCPGDDFAFFGNHIKEEQRQRAARYLPNPTKKEGDR